MSTFKAQSGAANPFNGIDVGDNSKPVLADLDKDGDLDVVIGEYAGNVNYYKNTGTASAPVFQQQTSGANPFNGVDLGHLFYAGNSAPALGDLDGDGDLDAVFGESDGTLNYYKNTGSSAAPAYSGQSGSANPFDNRDVGSLSTPTLIDLDNDGDLDAVIGEGDGNLNYYENTGTKSAPTFVSRTGAANPFNGIDVGTESTISFGDVDGDGDLDAVVGEDNGSLKYYENTGSESTPKFEARTGADNPFDGIDVGDHSAPTLADLDGDGDWDLVVGESDGTLNYFVNNSSPRAVDDTLSATEDTEVTFTAAELLGNDIDAEKAQLSIASVTSGTGGTAVLNEDGTVTFTPNENFNGKADFTYIVTDGTQTSKAATAIIEVAAVNDAPIAVEDTLSTTEDTEVTFTAAELLGNDTDVEKDLLSIASVTSGTGGTAVLNPDGTVTFTPDADFNGKADFTYTVTDGTDTSTKATVTVDVAAVNDAPVAVADEFSTDEDTAITFTAEDLVGNDTDVEKDELTIASVKSGTGGTAVLNEDGTVTFTPDADFNGEAEFTYTVTDGTDTSAAMEVDVTVAAINDVPIAVDDKLIATEDTEVIFAAKDLLGNDPNVDNEDLTIASVKSGTGGTAVLNEDGTVTFTPDANFHGKADFTYTVTDGTYTSEPATATVDVASVDDGPPELNARIEFQSTAEASPFTFTIPEGTFVDPDGDPMTYQARLVDNDGNLVDLPEWLSFDAATTTFTGTPQIDEVLYIRVDATDAFGGNTFDFFELTVTPTNDAPVAEVDELWAVEDKEKTYAASRLLNNDTDEEGDTLIIASVKSGTGGTVVLNDDGSVTFTPEADFHGQADFTYTVSDGTDISAPVQVIVNVTPVNDAPVAVDDTLKAEEDTPVTFTAADLLGNDTDADNDKLTIASVTSGSGGTVVLNEDGTVTFTPDPDFNGEAEFTYTISDGSETSVEAKATVEVAPINDVPIAVADELAAVEDTPVTFTASDLLGNDTDVEKDGLAIASVTSGIGGTAVLNEDGTVTFTPDENFNGEAEFTYTVTDGTDTSDEAKVEVEVAPVNDVPVAAEDEFATDEDTPVTFTAADLLGNDTDAENDELAIASVTSGIGGTAVLNEDGTVTFTPDADFNGKAEFTYTVTDGTDTSVEAKVEVEVAPVNDAPIAADDAPEFNAAPGIEATGNVLANDTEIDVGDKLSVTAVRTGSTEDSGTAGEVGLALAGSYGSLLLNADGSYTYEVDATNATVQALSRNAKLQDVFNYTVDDGQGGTDTAVLTVTFNGPNHAPVLVRTIPDLTVTEDAAMQAYTVPAGPTNRIFRDADGDKLTYSASLVDGSDLPPWLHFDAATRRFSGTPDDSGRIEVRVTVTDGDVTASDVFRLTITPVNDAPLAEEISGEAGEDGPGAELKAVFLDQDKGDTHTFAVDTTGTLGKVVNNEDGTFSYDPNGAFEWLGEGQETTDTFSYTVKDAAGAESTMTATVTITGANDAPEAEEIAETASEDGPAVTLTADFSDVDEGDTHTFTVDSEETIGIVVNNEDGTFNYDPNGKFEYLADGEKATDTFTYTVTDTKGEQVTRTATVTINGANDAPVLTGQQGEMPVGVEDTSYTIPTDTLMSYLLAGYTDIEGQELTAVDITVDHGSLIDKADGTWEYTPEADYSGEVKVSYVVEDEQGGEVQAELVFKVTATPDAPVVMTSLEDQVIGDGHAFEYRIQDAPTFTDADTPYGDELTFTATLKDGKPLPAWLTLDAETGVFSGTPKGSDVGVLTLKVTATDKLGASVYDYVKFTVQDVDNAPTGKVSLTGAIKDGRAPELAALTVDTTTLADADGLGLLAYQWQSRTEDGDWTDIGGATKESFTPNDETAGLAIRVVTSYTDGGGTLNEIASDEVLISDARNTQHGNAAANVLTGTAVTDRIYGAAGNDVIDGLNGDDQLYGQVGRDTLRGGEGNDWLDGGLGIDNMAGGRGADTYVVDNIGDVVTEMAGAGIDTVRSSVDHKLGAFVERLILTGTDAINGTGNGLDNRLIGNSADNVLDGGRGSDTLSGGEGSDTFRLLSEDAADLVLDFTSGLDRLALAGAELGNGDKLLDGALELAGPGGFGTTAELVIFATDIFGDITADSAAAAIGSATEAYAVGDTRLFVVDNGQDTALYQFEAGNADASVDAAELTLIGVLQSTAQTVLADYQLV